METLLNQLTGRLEKIFSTRLVSVVLYGSAAGGEFHGEFSDINILCVLKQVTPLELRDSEPIFRWWRQQGNPAPLLLSEDEVRTSTDCFSIEFHDMKERRRVLAGVDVIETLEVDGSFYRAQVEHELRAKLLRLRQKAAGMLSDNDLLTRLIADSLSTFCVFFRHALRLHGSPTAGGMRAVIDAAAAEFQLDAAPLLTILSIRENKGKPAAAELLPLFTSYLTQIGKVIDRVDQLQK